MQVDNPEPGILSPEKFLEPLDRQTPQEDQRRPQARDGSGPTLLMDAAWGWVSSGRTF